MCVQISSINNKRIYPIITKHFNTNNASDYQSDYSVDLPNYKINPALISRNNINFKNISTPIDITSKYNVNEGRPGHLDLPNIKVYEYPDTNLQLMINFIENSEELPQYNLCIDSVNDNNYDAVKQALINNILFMKFKANNLGDYYNFDAPYTTTILIVTGMEHPLNISDLISFNKILTSSNFTQDEIAQAKQELINYLMSDKYKQDNSLGLKFYSKSIISKRDTIDKINKISDKELKDYYDNFIKTSSAKAVLTINRDDLKNPDNKILANINEGINATFSDITEYKPNTNNTLNNKIQIIHINSEKAEAKIDYPIKSDCFKENIIADFLPKIFVKYSDTEKKRMRDYIDSIVEEYNSNDKREIESYRKLIEEREYANNFMMSAGKMNKLFVEPPLEFIKTNKNNYGDNYYSFYYSNINSNSNIGKILNEQKEIFQTIINSDISDLLEEIKTNYKNNLKYYIKEDSVTSLKNLYTALYNTDVFNIFETVDSITQDDIKNVINIYFLNQKPFIELNCSEDIYNKIGGEFN